MSLEQTIAKNVAQYRKAKGLTQKDLCKKTGLTQGQVSALERGRPANIKTLERVADALEIPAYELLRESEVDRKTLYQKLEEIASLSPERQQVLEVVLRSLLHEEQLQKMLKRE